MRNVTYIRVALFALVLAALALSIDTGWQRPHAAANLRSPDRQTFSVIADSLLPEALVNSGYSSPKLIPSSPKPVSSNSTFFTVRPDLRRCASPMCGGFYVRPVNHLLIPCANGRLMAECYVAEIDWNGQSQVDARQALLRGEVRRKTYSRFGNLGEFRVNESWQAASDHQPAGVFYRVRDRGVRCITFPCPSHSEMKLNSRFSQSIAGVNLTGAGAKEDLVGRASAAMTGGEGVLVAGDHATVTGPGGRMPELRATQFYLRAGQSQAMKPCIKTGCSSQVCSDRNVITTCEWRPEYACYQKATCERQANGNCGFTQTTELTSCLMRK